MEGHCVIVGKLNANGDMSHADTSIMGLEHGKIGDRIAVVLDGKQIYKRLYKPTNPRTPKQQMHRAKIAFANHLSKTMAEAVNLGFAMVPESGSGQSPRNAFVKANWNNGALVWIEHEQGRATGAECDRQEVAGSMGAPDNASAGLTGEWGIRPELLMLADGPRYIDRSMTATVSGGRLHVSCPNPGLNDTHAVKDDRLMVAVYRPSVPTMYLFEGPLREDCRESNYELPEGWRTSEGKQTIRPDDEEDTAHVYVWFQATKYHRSGGGKVTVRSGQASPSVYVGELKP